MGATKTLNVRNVDLGSEIMKITSGNGIERICEASGHAPTLNASFKWLRKGGKMGIVGLPKDTVKFDNPLTGKYTKSTPEQQSILHSILHSIPHLILYSMPYPMRIVITALDTVTETTD